MTRLVDLDSLNAETLGHLVSLRRDAERRAHDERCKEISELDELRTTWHEQVPNRPTIGAYRSAPPAAFDLDTAIAQAMRADPAGMMRHLCEELLLVVPRERAVVLALADARAAGMDDDSAARLVTFAVREVSRDR